jgi:hypothetical protein
MKPISRLLMTLLAFSSFPASWSQAEVVYRATPQVFTGPSGPSSGAGDGGGSQTPVPTAPNAKLTPSQIVAGISDGAVVGPATYATLKNDGTASSGIVSFTLSGSYFVLGGGTCSSGVTVLAPGGSCTIGVARKATANDIARTDLLTASFAAGTSATADVSGGASGFETCVATGSACADGSYHVGDADGFRYFLTSTGNVPFNTGSYDGYCPAGFQSVTAHISAVESFGARNAVVIDPTKKYWSTGYPNASNGYAFVWTSNRFSGVTVSRSSSLPLICSKMVAI